MTDEEWSACQEPMVLLYALPEKVSNRKAKLFRCACRTLVWQGLLRDRARSEASGDMLARLVMIATAGDDEAFNTLIVNYWSNDHHFWESCPGLSEWLRWLLAGPRFGPEAANAIRELWANPSVRLRFLPEWRTSTVIDLANQVFHERDFEVMPILADALQDAGCDNEKVLAHCRAPEAHLPGCWAIDLILGLD